MLHKTQERFTNGIAPVEVISADTGGARRYGVELYWDGGWTGTITVEAPRGGVVHSVSVSAQGFAAFSGWADWPQLRVVAAQTGGVSSKVIADVYLIGLEE